MLAANRVEVDGAASASSIFAQSLGFGLVPVKSLSVAQKRQVEIMLVLDRSGSMAGQPMTDLKKAAHAFVEYFKSTQAEDKMGLISFHTYALVDQPLGINFYNGMNTAITNMQVDDWTNAEDAVDQADGPKGFTPQGGVAPADRIAQFMLFFSDGRPNSFRYNFVNKGAVIDGIVTQESNCDPGAVGNNVRNWMTGPTGATLASPTPTGDGKATASACGNTNSTRWLIMDAYPVPTACSIPEPNVLCQYVCDMAENLALLHANEEKAAGITIYTVGYGTTHDAFMKGLASNSTMYYKAPTTADLQGIFQHIALEIKLRLVQ